MKNVEGSLSNHLVISYLIDRIRKPSLSLSLSLSLIWLNNCLNQFVQLLVFIFLVGVFFCWIAIGFRSGRRFLSQPSLSFFCQVQIDWKTIFRSLFMAHKVYNQFWPFVWRLKSCLGPYWAHKWVNEFYWYWSSYTEQYLDKHTEQTCSKMYFSINHRWFIIWIHEQLRPSNWSKKNVQYLN